MPPLPESTPRTWRQRLRTPLRVLLGLLVLDLGVWAFADVWQRHSPDDYAMRVAGCNRHPQDLVIVGGSPVSEGIVPDELRGSEFPRVYALGLPGGTTTEFYHAMLRSCPTPPRLLIYGITASDINDSRNEPHGPASLMTLGDVCEWATTRPESREWVVRQYLLAKASRSWSLFRYRHGIRMWSALQADALAPGAAPEAVREARELRHYADAILSGNGYAPAAGFVARRHDINKQTGAELPPFAFLNKYKTGSHLKYLHKIIDWSNANGTQLILLDMPVTSDLEAQYPEAFAEYRQRLSEIERQRGVTILRAHRDIVGITDAGFADTIHLNGVGAKVLSQWLRHRLDELRQPSEPNDDRVRAQAGGSRP